MRCLYCGKELALLKRWTGGGEFCSDAHRQRYQEEYNQLALNRLLQAKPPAKPNEAPPAGEAKPVKPLPVAEPAKEAPAHTSQRVSAPQPEPATLRISEPPRTKPAYHAPAPIHETLVAPVVAPVVAHIVEEPVHVEPPPPEEPAPAEAAGFFVEMPVAVLAEVAPMSHPDLEFLGAVAAALPNRTFEPLNLRR